MIMAERASSAQLEARVRVLENSATRQDVRFDALLNRPEFAGDHQLK
jgi:hypothetical protein